MFYKVFLEILQNSQEKTCVRPVTLFSCEFCEIFKNNFSTEQLQATASGANPPRYRRFGNLGIGNSASALALASALASALQKSYLYLTHFFLEKIEYHAQYASIFFLVQLVLSYLKIFALFNVRVFVFSC